MKHNIRLSIVVICIVLIFSGCATKMSYDQIAQKASATNRSDGIDRREAILLAQNFIIQNELDAIHSVHRIGEVRKEGEKWLIQFNSALHPYESDLLFAIDEVKPLWIMVEANTGRTDIY